MGERRRSCQPHRDDRSLDAAQPTLAADQLRAENLLLTGLFIVIIKRLIAKAPDAVLQPACAQ